PDGPLRRTTTPEGHLLRHFQEALRQEPDVLVWRNTTGVTKHDGRRVTYGLTLGFRGGEGPSPRLRAIGPESPPSIDSRIVRTSLSAAWRGSPARSTIRDGSTIRMKGARDRSPSRFDVAPPLTHRDIARQDTRAASPVLRSVRRGSR